MTHINLTDSCLGPYGGIAFGKGLESNKSLININLSRNHLTDDGVIILGQ